LGGASSLKNRNTIILTILSIIYGLAVYGFLGLYPTFLREQMHYAPAQAGTVIGFFGLGSLASLFGGWLGDRFSPKLVIVGSSLAIGVLGFLFYLPGLSMLSREFLVGMYGVIGSSILYVNLAGYHIKALRRSLSSRGSGTFVTSLYAGAAFGGYFMGSLVTQLGWMRAGEIQISLLTVIGAGFALLLRQDEMSR
jgi:MFS family permease